MATNKECNCIENALSAISLATEMKDSSFFHIQSGYDFGFKQMSEGSIPKNAKSLTDLIYKDATLLDKKLQSIEIDCKLQLGIKVDDYLEGKRLLSGTIKSQGRNLSAAYISGIKIVETLQEIASRKKLISCD